MGCSSHAKAIAPRDSVYNRRSVKTSCQDPVVDTALFPKVAPWFVTSSVTTALCRPLLTIASSTSPSSWQLVGGGALVVALLYIVQVMRLPGFGAGDVGFGAWLTLLAGIGCQPWPIWYNDGVPHGGDLGSTGQYEVVAACPGCQEAW